VKTYLIALGILLALVIWMLTGLTKSSDSKTAQAEPVSKPVTSVRVKEIQSQSKLVTIELRGRTEAKRIVDITAQIAGVLISTPIEKGQRVKKGDLLCEIAEEDRKAQLARAKANVEKAQLDFDGAQKLFNDGMISSSALASNRAVLENEKAMLQLAQLNVQHLQMRAPFDGFVESRPANVGALIERGQICARLVDEQTLLATSQASEKQIQQLQLGQAAKVKLIDGTIINGSISFMGRTADPTTRTYSVEIELDTQGVQVRDGLTAQISLPMQTVLAHHISPAVFALNDKGEVSVRVVNQNDVVEMLPVNVVAEDIDGVWITGLPNKVRLIVVGQELVSVGESVSATMAQ
jgi:membrane fusion protein, multidrug efflux system